jgi:hypothetical protein
MIEFDSNNYSHKRGIYKDLYNAISAEKNKEAISQAFRPRKGIYQNLYRQIEEDKKAPTISKEKKNIWHQYPLKALVYTNDLGEALRPIIGNFYAKLSWLPSIIYTFFAISKNNKKAESGNLTREILFQLFASFLLPLLMLKATRKIFNKIIDKIPLKSKETIKTSIKSNNWLYNFCKKFEKEKTSGHRNIGLSTLGLLVLAIAVKPIDNFVEHSLDKLYAVKGDI